MKKGYIISIAFTLGLLLSLPISLNSQMNTNKNSCSDMLKAPFISNGQPFRAFLTGDEVAEFHTTFFNGSMYRLVACSGKEDDILFSVYDQDRRLLFSNNEHNNAKVWDFKISGSIECIIEARLNPKQTTSGLAMMYVGFKSLED